MTFDIQTLTDRCIDSSNALFEHQEVISNLCVKLVSARNILLSITEDNSFTTDDFHTWLVNSAVLNYAGTIQQFISACNLIFDDLNTSQILNKELLKVIQNYVAE